MNLTIEIPDELVAALKAHAQAEGMSPDRYIRYVIENSLSPALEPQNTGKPFETGYGMWSKYGRAPSPEEIDENRREMFQGFAKDF